MTDTENLPAITDEYCLKEFGWTKSQFEVVRNTFFKGLSVDHIKIFGHVCKHTGLDPFLKQIYPVMRGDKLTIQTAIDGYRVIAERTNRYSPGREPTFTYDKNGEPISATAYVKKMTKDGTWHEVAATAYSKEYNPGVGPFWKKMPHTMIAKCAEALALRKSFPEQLSGVYTSEEMDQANNSNIPQAQYEEVISCQNDNHNDNDKLPIPTKSVFDPIEKEVALNQEQIDTLASYLPKLTNKCKSNFFDFFGIKNETELNKIPAHKYQGTINSFKLNIESQKVSS